MSSKNFAELILKVAAMRTKMKAGPRQNWAMGGKKYPNNQSYELWISGLLGDTVKVALPGSQTEVSLDLFVPFVKVVESIRIRYSEGVLRFEGLSGPQMKVLSKEILKWMGYSDLAIDESQTVLERCFRIYPVKHKGKAYLVGHRADAQQKLNISSGLVHVRIRRVRERTYLSEIHGLKPGVAYKCLDGNLNHFSFKTTLKTQYQLKRGRLETWAAIPVMVIHGFNNVELMVQHFASLNGFKFPKLQKPARGKSLVFQV